MGSSYFRKQLPIAGIIYIGQILAGFGMGWIIAILNKLHDQEESPLDDSISFTTGAWINAFAYIGYIIGPYITGYFSNIFGRKACLLIGGIITALSYLLVIFTFNLTMIFALRILQGFGIGTITVGNIVYLGEIAPKKNRGTMLTTIGIANNLGLLLVIHAVGPYMSFAGTGWVGLVLSLMYVGAGLFIPETPIFYVIKENEDEAKRILINLGRADEIDEVLATKKEKEEKTKAAAWKELFTVRSNRRALTMLLALGVFQQLSGVVAMSSFILDMFYASGLWVSPHLVTLIVGLTQLGSSCLTPMFVESFGRKKLLLVSISVCSAILAALGGYFIVADQGNPVATTIGWIPVTALITFFVFYGFGFGIIPSTLAGEMFSSNVRSTGTTVILTLSWLTRLGVSLTLFFMLSVSMYFMFWFFAAACVCAAVFTAIYVPETKGKSLLEIQEMLE